MTTRYAYFVNGEPYMIYEDVTEVMAEAQSRGDDLPLSKPVTLGEMNMPSTEEILDMVCARFRELNIPWSRGMDRYEQRLRRAVEANASRLANSMADFTRKVPGYVVDTRDLEHIRSQAQVRTIPTGEIPDEEE